jgi:hypothetical protein
LNLLDLEIHLQSAKAIHIPTGGTWSGIKVDDYIPSSLEILNTFVIENNLRLVDVFNRFDKDKSGDISIVELKNGLKEIGVKMTNRLGAMLDQGCRNWGSGGSMDTLMYCIFSPSPCPILYALQI